MTNILQKLSDKKAITPPRYVPGSLQYMTIMGSEAYGVGTDKSDRDVYGFCIPPKHIVFPHTAGYIQGFGRAPERFDQYQQHHILDEDTKCIWDFSIYNIVKYFQLCMENNPNMIDSLFTPQRCVLVSTKIGNLIRDCRRDFLHKGAWHKFKGYAFSQMRKMSSQNRTGKRKEAVEKYGYDPKFAYHTVRLLNEVEQVLIERDLTLDRNREQLKDIRQGNWSLEQVQKYFYNKEKQLEDLYTSSKLPYGPEEDIIRALLFQCLEQYYGSLEQCVVLENKINRDFNKILDICRKYI